MSRTLLSGWIRGHSQRRRSRPERDHGATFVGAADLAAGEIVRSWPMRGTLHVVAPEDLWWILGITGPRQRNLMAKRRRDLEISDHELARAGDVTYYLQEGLEPAGSDVAALPGFDEYVLGYQDRTAALTPERFEKIVPGGNGIFYPTLVIDGEILGTWKRTETAKTIVVTVDPFASLSARARAGFTRAMTRYEAFIGKPVEVRFP